MEYKLCGLFFCIFMFIKALIEAPIPACRPEYPGGGVHGGKRVPEFGQCARRIQTV